MRSLLHDLLRLIRSWYRVDRIRTSPVAGQLLRLEVPTLLGLSGRWWTVESRAVGDGAAGPFVGYRCRDGEATGWLEVRPPPPFGTGAIRWTCADETVAMHPDDIEVYAPAP
jgi:hypothetical protein